MKPLFFAHTFLFCIIAVNSVPNLDLSRLINSAKFWKHPDSKPVFEIMATKTNSKTTPNVKIELSESPFPGFRQRTNISWATTSPNKCDWFPDLRDLLICEKGDRNCGPLQDYLKTNIDELGNDIIHSAYAAEKEKPTDPHAILGQQIFNRNGPVYEMLLKHGVQLDVEDNLGIKKPNGGAFVQLFIEEGVKALKLALETWEDDFNKNQTWLGFYRIEAVKDLVHLGSNCQVQTVSSEEKRTIELQIHTRYMFKDVLQAAEAAKDRIRKQMKLPAVQVITNWFKRVLHKPTSLPQETEIDKIMAIFNKYNLLTNAHYLQTLLDYMAEMKERICSTSNVDKNEVQPLDVVAATPVVQSAAGNEVNPPKVKVDANVPVATEAT